jgi:hypothetical protein
MRVIARSPGVVAHALVRAVFALMRTPGIHTSVNAARICACATVVACLLVADTHSDILEVFTSMAAALSDSNVSVFMNAFDKDLPGYGKLKSDITALLTQADISSSVEPINDEGGDTTHSMDLDWFLQIRSQLPDGPIVNRRQIIHCELRKQGKHWKIVSMTPMDFFAPAKLDK